MRHLKLWRRKKLLHTDIKEEFSMNYTNADNEMRKQIAEDLKKTPLGKRYKDLKAIGKKVQRMYGRASKKI